MSPTPPSTTSSSFGAVSPEGQFRVIRKRNRVPLSCGPCRHRKLKCNRSNPCENCVKRGDASSCSYAQVNARKKHSSLQTSSSSPDDMQNRIDRLESLVLSLMTNGSQSAGPAAAMAAISGNSSSTGSIRPTTDIDLDGDEEALNGTEESDTEQVTKSFGIMKVDNNKSYYISEAHWVSLLNDIAEVRNFFTSHKKQYDEQVEKLKTTRMPTDIPGSTLLFGAMKPTSREEIMSSFPSRYTTDMLIARYFNSYDPATHILHGPTFQAQYNKHWEDPSQTCIVWVGMLFAMMRLAMLSYHREGDEPPEFRGKSLDMAGTFRNLTAHCLALANYTKPYPYLIESLIFHLHGDFCQTKEADVSVWVLVGVIARLAMMMGYHRDSKMFPNITPFQGEMRRRVWAFVRQSDLLFSYQVGLPSMLRNTDSDTELPRNLYDDDFGEDCKELPPSRPPNEPTPISFLIAKARLTNVFGRVSELISPPQSGSYDKVMELDAELRRARDLIPEHLIIRPMEECQLDTSNLILARFAIMSVYHKAQCVLHRAYLIRARVNPRFTYSRRTCIDSAMELLRFQSMLHIETRPTGRLRSRQNRVTSLSSTDFLLAATLVAFDLYHGLQLQAADRASGDTFAWGRDRRQEMIAALHRSKEIWDELRDETLEAWKAAGLHEVMLAKLNLGSPENGTNAPAFEPQDEKQSAAMTLGLLSSGMSPMNSGPPGFNDAGIKTAETPLAAQGGLGPTADFPGAPSPFNTMFGQLPDMQLNLDWDAWDTYIQSSTLDTPNQWWPTTMDTQQQPQSQGQSPLSNLNVPAVQQSGVADRMRSSPRYPNIFASEPVHYDTNGPQQPAPGQGGSHCFRRAAFRLLSSSASAPTRSSWAVASRPRFVFPHQQSQLLIQSRWFSDDLQKQFDGSKNAPSPDKEEVLVVESAVQSADVRSTKAEDISADEVATTQVDGPIPEESKRTKRLRLLEKEPVAKETVFVGNLFYDVTADDLRAQMEKYGVVENVSIVFDSRGMSRGFGYVQFDTVDTAKRAVEAMHLRVFEGRRVTVQFAQNNVNRTKPLQPASKTIYLGNLSFEMTDRDLNDLFKDVHNVIDVRVSVDRRTGQTRGFAHAEFIDVESARIGFETLSQKAPYGRKIRLDYSHTNRTADRVKNDKQ